MSVTQTKNDTVKITASVDPQMFKDRVPIMTSETSEGVVPGFDNFSITNEMVEGAKLANGSPLGDVYWNSELKTHTDRYTFHWVGNHALPDHSRIDRALQVRHSHKGSVVLDSEGHKICNDDLVLMAIPIEVEMKKRQLADEKRMRDEESTKADVPYGVDGFINTELLPHMDRSQISAFKRKAAEEAAQFLSPTHGRPYKEVFESKGNTNKERMIRIREEMIQARRGGAKNSNPIDSRLRAEAEVMYVQEYNRAQETGGHYRSLHAITGALFARSREQVQADQRSRYADRKGVS